MFIPPMDTERPRPARPVRVRFRFAPGLVAASTRATLADGFVLTETALEPGEPVAVVRYPSVE